MSKSQTCTCIWLFNYCIERRGISTSIACCLQHILHVRNWYCPGSLLRCCTIIILFCLPIGNITLRKIESGQFVCPNSPVSLECTVPRTRLLRWRINSTQLTCLGNKDNGTVCLNSGNGAHAMITMVLTDSENLANITSLLFINDVGGSVNISCESQVTGVQIRSASMLNDTD